MKLKEIKGIGKKKEEALNKLGIYNCYDLITYLPKRYEDRSEKTMVVDSINGLKHFYELNILSFPRTSFFGKNKTITRVRATDEVTEINIIWYNDRFSAQKIKTLGKYKVFGTFDLEKKAIINPIISTMEDDLIGGISPIYSVNRGVSIKEISKYKNLALDLVKLEEYLTEKDIAENNLLEVNEMYVQLHKPENRISLYNSIFSLSFRNLFLDKLTNYYFKLMQVKGFIKFNKVDISYIIEKLDFELTLDQKSAINEICNDMTSSKKMNRIVIGDVGSGKTIVGILASYIAIKNGYQVAFMAPTEVLANQHFQKYKKLFESVEISSNIITGSLSNAEKKNIQSDIRKGKIDIIFGTHALFQKSVTYNKLGLVVMDEQQRFGVNQRKLLSEKGLNPDLLLLSATPIPRTLALSLYDDLEISFIETVPSNRLPIKSYVSSINQEMKFIDFAYSRIKKGEQVYIVVPRVDDDEKHASIIELQVKLEKYFNKQVNIKTLYGNMTSDEKEDIQNQFNSNNIDILIATSIIEVGIDNPNATVMIIYDANMFGLSQLHQIRGRVGRSNKQSYCFFVLRDEKLFDEKIDFISKNLNGFDIAKKDLEIRGSGNLYGTKQSGNLKFDNSLILNEELIKNCENLFEKYKNKSNYVLDKIISDRIEKLDDVILN